MSVSTTAVELTATQTKAYSKTTADIYNEKLENARDIGKVSTNKARLNLISTLAKGEKEDWFSFGVLSGRGKLRLSAVNVSKLSEDQDAAKMTVDDIDAATAADDSKATLKGKGLRVEVYTKKGNRQVLVATNDESKTDEYAAFEKMVDGGYKTGKGTYYVHVTGEDGKAVDADTLYALQVQMGDSYSQNYTTQEKSVNYKGMSESDIKTKIQEEIAQSNQANTQYSGSMLAASSAASILADGYTNLAKVTTAKSAASILNLLA